MVDGATIAAVGTGTPPPADHSVDVAGNWLVPGFIDLHCHGGGGHRFDDGADAIRSGLAVHRHHGTTRSVISLVANPHRELRTSLAVIADLAADDPLILGSHLEGPWLAMSRRGAHDPDQLRPPDAPSVQDLIEAGRGALRQVTLAPELPGALDAIEALTTAGVVTAVGHTAADYALTTAAFDHGARLLTHAFNAMPGIGHRAPGPVVAAIDDRRVTIELILDGHHVAPAVANLLVGAAPGRVALVTDAMSAAGSPDGDYSLGSREVTVTAGRAVLRGTHTLAGSTLTQDAALRAAVTDLGVSPGEAIGALTTVPARVLGLGHRLGLLQPGYDADLVILDQSWAVTAVWAAGRRLR